jgi:hypothetical protein
MDADDAGAPCTWFHHGVLLPSRPLLRAVQNADDVDRIGASALLLARSAAVRERQQSGWRLVQCTNKSRRTFWRVLKEVLGDSLEIQRPLRSTAGALTT